MKLSFNDSVESNESGGAVAATEKAATAVAVGEESCTAHSAGPGQALAVRGQYDDLVGEISGEDLIFPRINLTQKVGEKCRELGIPAPESLAKDSDECAEWEDQYGEKHPFVGAIRVLAKLEASGYLRFERDATARVWHLDIEKFWGREGGNDVPF